MMIDITELQRELAKMSRYSKMYQVVKAEMQKRGNWKAAPRGGVFKKGFDERRHDRGSLR